MPRRPLLPIDTPAPEGQTLRALLAQREAVITQLTAINRELEELYHALGEALGKEPPADRPQVPTPRKARTVFPRAAVTPVAPSGTLPRNDRQAEILTFLRTRGPQPTRAIAQHLGQDRIVVKMACQRMRKVGILGSVGRRNGQKWTLPAASGGSPATAEDLAYETTWRPGKHAPSLSGHNGGSSLQGTGG